MPILVQTGLNRLGDHRREERLDVSEALQREMASLEVMTIFRVAESAGDCVGREEEKQSSRKP